MSRVWPLLFASTALGSLGCYVESVDPLLEGIYACEVDSDCAEGLRCELEVCTNGSTPLGPDVAILGPETLQVLPADPSVRLPVVIRGGDLELTEPGGANVNGQGHVEVLLDGQSLDILTTGSLDAGVQSAEFNVPVDAGLHRIMVVARRNDGSPYPNADAVAHSAFWVDDGREHVGFVAPAPGARVPVGGGDLEIEVATLNFTMVNPGLVPTDQLEAAGQGHVHVFFDRSVPECLPDCNFAYLSTGFPSGAQGSNILSIDAGALPTSEAGTFPLEVVAQNSAHNPYRRAETDDVVFDVVPIVITSD